MDGSAPDSGVGLSWYYLDSVQKEFGPFAQTTMRDWFTQGFFPNGEELMIRLPHWERHVALKMVWPDVSEAFMGMPRSSPPGPPPQVAEVESYNAYADLPHDMMDPRRPPDEQSPYLAGDMSQMGGCRFWGGQADASASVGPRNGMLGMQGELVDGMPAMSGLRPGQMAMPMSGGMQPGAMSGNMVAMSPMTGLMPGGAAPEGCGVDGQFAGYPAGYGAQGMMMQQMQPYPGTQLHLVPVPAGSAVGTNTRFRGRIKSFNAKQGFGFIENTEAYQIFGRDVFLHKAQIGNLKVGTEVTYTVEMNKFGMPQARDLATMDGKPPGPPPASVVKGGQNPKRPAGKKKAKEEDGANPRATTAEVSARLAAAAGDGGRVAAAKPSPAPADASAGRTDGKGPADTGQ